MKINKRTLFNIIFFAVVLLLTVIGLFRGQDIGDIWVALKKADFRYIIYACICILAFIVCQAIVLLINLRTLGYKCSIFRALKYAFVGYFFTSITPFGMGGPAIQVVGMKKDEVPFPVASVVVLLYSFIYKGVLVLIGFGVIFFGNGLFKTYLDGTEAFFIIGMILTGGFSFLLILFTFHPRLMKRFITWFIKWLEKKHILKHKEGRTEKIVAGMNRYRDTAAFFKEHTFIIVADVVIVLIQRFALFAVTYFVYRAFGLSGVSPFLIMLLQSVVPLCVDMLPIPGGVGISEMLFGIIFTSIFTNSLVMPGLVLSRGLGYYVQLILCGAVTLFGYFIPNRLREKKREQS